MPIRGLFNENHNYYIKLFFENYNKTVRIVIYFLDNDKNIIGIKDAESDIKYGYSTFRDVNIFGPSYRYFFINIENVTIGERIIYNIYEPFNSNEYTYSFKFYENYNINELPHSYDIDNYDYE